MKDKIAVVIVNYHCQDLVCRCLESIVSLGRDDLSFIIMDNSETPDTDRIQRLHPEATVLRPGSNLGFGGGNNAGIKHALDSGVTHVMIMNPDTTTETDFSPHYWKPLQNIPGLVWWVQRSFTIILPGRFGQRAEH
jgi:GT2 family glycosyltransferase